MASSLPVFLPIIIISIIAAARGSGNCVARCGRGDFNIRFPFGLKDRQDTRCGYPKFDLSCKNDTQVILNLPFSGEFNVQHIDYAKQAIYINDPQNCLPKRLMQQLNLSDSPFHSSEVMNLTFFKCSTFIDSFPPFGPISCLSGRNHSVIAVPTTFHNDFLSNTCSKVSVVTLPVWWNGWNPPMDFSETVKLDWDEPDCGLCDESGASCGFVSDSGLDVGCSYGLASNSDLPRNGKYGISTAAGLVCLLFLICLSCYSCCKIKQNHRPHLHRTSEFSTGLSLNHTVHMMGLNRPTIESYPKTQLGESGRLPKPNDRTCAICLSEYKPKETLRTMPECNHYFHAQCIDEWLNLNATCPLCRNTPDPLSPGSPSSTASLSSTASTSSSTS